MVDEPSINPLIEFTQHAMSEVNNIILERLQSNVPLIPGKNWPISEKFKHAQKRVLDKLGSNGRILVRASGTEPVIRVMAEAETEKLAKSCIDQLVLSL